MARSRSTSKQRSAASSSRRKPPEPLVFFIDRSLGRKKVPDALRAAGLDVRVHDELFPQATEDVVWLTEAAAKRWVVVTRDDRIRYNELEKQAPQRSTEIRRSGGRTWWAHFEFTPINTAPTFLPKK